MRSADTLFAAVAIAMLSACDGESGAPAAEPVRHYGLGHAASSQEIAARDIDVGPDGEGLPAGSGTAALGAVVYAKQCASCHGAKGEGIPPAYPALVGREPRTENFAFSADWKAPKTIGNYWPYATTVFDYVRRAMPQATPGTLTDDEVYSVTAWLLAENNVIPAATVLDARSLVAVKMPYASRFVRDTRRGGREVR